MGFNNKGVEHAVKQIRRLRHRQRYIIGGNIGKNKRRIRSIKTRM